MSAAPTPKFEGWSSELRYRIDDRSPLTFRDIFDELHGLMAGDLPGHVISTIAYDGHTLTVKTAPS